MPLPQLVRKVRTYGEIDENEPPRRPLHRRKPFFTKKNLMLAGVFVLGCFVLISIAIAIIGSDMPDPNKLNDRQVAQSTKIYDRTGTHILYEIFQNQKRTAVTLAQMSPYLPKAVVAIEDKNFYTHSGVRYLSILRATFNNLIGRRVGAGGASTITQQLLKNAVLGNKPGKIQTIIRKIRELVLAPRLEKKYSKDEIIQMYLNEIPFGSTNYGVESAAQGYFHKAAKDLSLSESATLAAIIQAPSRYLNDQENLQKRRNYVIDLMVEQGYAREPEAKLAKEDPLKITKNKGILAAPHFVLYVKQLLADELGESVVDTGGLKVITTLDFDMQVSAESIVKELGDKYSKEYDANNAALLSIDPKTGQILAMVGSRDFENDEIDGQFNVTILAKRQPGSSLKPFVYTAAFEKGFTPETVIYDVSTNFDMRTGEKYTPKNYDGKEHGLLTIRKALQGSLNIPAVKTMYLVGEEKMTDVAKRFHYTTLGETEIKRASLSLVLGGAEVTLLDHTNAYATLANNGIYHQPASIISVTNLEGDKIKEWKQDDGEEALKPELAATISNVLSDNTARIYIFGANNNLILPGRPVATKTGTTNNNKDAWTMGYTPSIATGVWVGNTIPTPMKAGGNTLAGSIWNKYMREVTKKMPVENFPTPPPNTTVKPVLRGADGGIKLAINSITGKIATSSTPESLIIEKIYLPPHDILHYVNKDDPQGPAPTTPSDDPQYQNWENALQDWVTRMNKKSEVIVLEEPPTELDPLQSSELMPKVEFVSPTTLQTITSRDMVLEVRATAPRGVVKVVFQIDNMLVGYANTFPFKTTYTARSLTNGKHIIKAIAQDDLGNMGESTIEFEMNAIEEPASFDWGESQNITIQKDAFPRKMYLLPFRWEAAEKLSVYLTTNEIKKLIYTFKSSEDKPTDSGLSFTWNHYPGAGEYIMTGELVDKSGSVVTKDLKIEVK